MPKVSNAKSKTVKRFPLSENGPSVRCTTVSGNEFFITQNMERKRFTLWHKVDGGYEQISTAKSPIDLDEKISWDK